MVKLYQPIPLLSISLFISFTPIFSVPLYNSGFSNPVSMGLGSIGIGLKNSNSALYSNPGYLNQNKKQMVGIGFQGSVYGSENSPILPGGAGFYFGMDNSKWGFWGAYNPVYTSHLPDRENIYVIAANLGFSYEFSENLHISIGVGPSGMHRFRSTSDWSLSGFIHSYYEIGNWSIGLGVEIPGKFFREDYLGGEKLQERTPERLSLGIGYEWIENIGVYSEVRRILWERAEIYRNGINETPDWERGLGAEIGISTGIFMNRVGGSQWTLRSGLDWSGGYDSMGRNRRGLGIGMGIGSEWNINEEVLGIDLGIMDTTLTAKSKGPFPETQYSFSISYRYK